MKLRTEKVINTLLVIGSLTLAAALMFPNQFYALAATVADNLKGGIPASATALTAASGKIIVGNGTSYAESSMSGDATIASGGAVTVGKANGITMPSSVTGGGLAYYSSSSAMASSGAMTNHAIVLGSGGSSAPRPYIIPAGTILVGNGSGSDPAGLASSNNSQVLGVSFGGPSYRMANPYTGLTAAYTVLDSDCGSVLDVAASTINLSNITLPAAATILAGYTICISKADSNTNVVPITCNTADAIDGGFAYIDSTNTAPTINTTATVNRTTTTVTIKMTTDPTTKFVVGGLVTVNLAVNTSVNGTWVITSMTSTTVVYTDITSGTITNSNDTGTVTGPNTWLAQQHAKLWLMSTGAAGTGAKQGWTVISGSDWTQSLNSSGTAAPTSTQYGDITSLVLMPGEWDLTGNINLSSASTTVATAGISTNSGNSSTGLTLGDNVFYCVLPSASNLGGGSIASWRQTITTPKIYYLKANLTFSVSATVYGRLSARRIR